MNFVEPIRDQKKIAQIKNLLRAQEHFRDLLLFVVGINTALCIGGRLELVEGAGHYPGTEMSVVTAPLVLDFLNTSTS